MSIILYVFNQKSLSEFVFYISLDFGRVLTTLKSNPYNFTLPRCSHFSNLQNNKSNASILLPALLYTLHIQLFHFIFLHNPDYLLIY